MGQLPRMQALPTLHVQHDLVFVLVVSELLAFVSNGFQFSFLVIGLLREDLITRKPLWTLLSLSLKRIQKPKKPVVILF